MRAPAVKRNQARANLDSGLEALLVLVNVRLSNILEVLLRAVQVHGTNKGHVAHLSSNSANSSSSSKTIYDVQQ